MPQAEIKNITRRLVTKRTGRSVPLMTISRARNAKSLLSRWLAAPPCKIGKEDEHWEKYAQPFLDAFDDLGDYRVESLDVAVIVSDIVASLLEVDIEDSGRIVRALRAVAPKRQKVFSDARSANLVSA